ncbi:hypothetical protein [Sphingobacterium sp. LRF_L2]|uniref:hypothetical protein n=1 Tax=Sphingobacterium sp. LRF_L2 TaxID=3369421 RepID=UPI003F62312A
MKNINLCIVFLILGISIGFAQERGKFQEMSATDRAKGIVERLTDELALEKSQQDSIYKQALAQATAEKEIFANASGDRETIRTAMQENRKKFDTKIKSFLNEKQLKTYEELESKRGQRPPKKD